MAEFKLTFEDGSDGYLAHHGIKGMKWGVWNEETRRRHLGMHAQKRAEKEKAKQLANLEKRSSEAGRYASTKDKLSDDLKKHGHRSDVAEIYGDYYRSGEVEAKQVDKLVKGKGGLADEIKSAADFDRKLMTGYKALQDELKSMDTKTVSAKEIRKWARNGEMKMRNLRMSYSYDYDYLVKDYDRGNIKLGGKNLKW